MKIIKKVDIKNIQVCEFSNRIPELSTTDLLIVVDNTDTIEIDYNDISKISLFTINFHHIIKDGKWVEDVQHLKNIIVTSDRFTELTFIDMTIKYDD